MFKILLNLIVICYLMPICASPIVSELFISPDWNSYDCHSSSLVETQEGEILSVWKAGFGDGRSNIDLFSRGGIWQRHLDKEKLGEVEQIHFEMHNMIWNPVLTCLASGEILLFYRIGNNPRSSCAFIRRSYDGGRKWELPELLPAGIIGPAKNKPVILNEGTMICPSSLQVGAPEDSFKATAVWMDITCDGGRTWSKTGPLAITGQPFGVIEPALFFDGDGNLHIFCRDRALRDGKANGCIWTAMSCDRGNTWSSLEKTILPNPDSAFDIVDMGEGKLVLFYNSSHTQRFPLTIAISVDGGKTWENVYELEKQTGEFPAAILAKDGFIHVTYAHEIASGQRRIKYVVLNSKKLFEKNLIIQKQE